MIFPSTTVQLLSGIAAIAVGLFAGSMIGLHEDGLRTPPWVALAAAMAFVFAGLAAVARAVGAVRYQPWFIGLLTLCLLVPSAWIAFAPGDLTCSSFPAFLPHAEIVCRAGFAVCAVVMIAIIAVLIRHFTRHK